MVEAGRVLQPELRVAVLVTLGADGWDTGSLLQERIRAVAEHIDRDARTVRRRIATGFTELAKALLARHAVPASADSHAPRGWYVESLHARLGLGSPTSTLTEEREIVSQVDGLSELTVGLAAPQPSGEAPVEIGVTAEHGCTATGARRVSPSYWTFVLHLPRTLRTGERHRYGVTFPCPPMHVLQPYYVLSPLRRVKRFSAEVDFGDPDSVDLVWRVDGVTPSVLRDGEPTDQLCDIDTDGVVRESFSDIVQGLSYGVAWRLPVGPSTRPSRSGLFHEPPARRRSAQQRQRRLSHQVVVLPDDAEPGVAPERSGRLTRHTTSPVSRSYADS